METKTKRTSLFANGLIWFGAAVCIDEIVTGTYYAPLGLSKGLAAILLGHLIGCLMLFAAGIIGAKSRKSSMETVKNSFGQKGGLMFAGLNVLQLVGWTAIMIYFGALAANSVLALGNWFWCLILGALIIVWIMIGITNLGKVNVVAMTALFFLTLILCKSIFFGGGAIMSFAGGEAMSFGAAVELAVAMPLSWLPLISDYTREAEKPVAATAVSALTYGIVSCWMYTIGLGAALFTGASDITQIMLQAGLGMAALVIFILSTVTTTFLDAYSAGVSSEAIYSRINGKWMGIAVAVIGAAAAMIYPMDNFTNFLYLIGSVFAPMIAIMIADYFLLHKDSSSQLINIPNLCVWLAGFIIYRLLMNVETVVGNTLPDMLLTIVLCLVVNKAVSAVKLYRQRHVNKLCPEGAAADSAKAKAETSSK